VVLNMRRSLLFLSCCLTAIATLGAAFCAAPTKEDKNAETYYPSKKGAKWVYEWRYRSSPPDEQIEILASVDARRDGTVMTVNSIDDRGEEFMEKILVSRSGLYKLQSLQTKLDPPLCILKLPFKSDSEWEDETGNSKGKCVERKIERVKVPAGSYDAIRVEWEGTIDGNALSSKSWYAPKVGLVKEVWGDEDRVKLLKAFAPGKD
jgi:hypothetical protein